MRTRQLSLPKPCTQDWSAMQDRDQGKFCSHCQKTVIDFTGYDDAAFIAYFQKAKTPPCGRFTQRQLSLTIPRPAMPLWSPAKLYRYLTAGLLTIVSVPAITQARPATTITANTTQEHNAESGQAPEAITGTDTVTIQGTITDMQGKTIAGVTIRVQKAGIEMTTDAYGHFSFKIAASQRNTTVLLIGADGFEIKKVNLADHGDRLTVALGEPVLLGDVEYVEVKPPVQQRSTKPSRKKH